MNILQSRQGGKRTRLLRVHPHLTDEKDTNAWEHMIIPNIFLLKTTVSGVTVKVISDKGREGQLHVTLNILNLLIYHIL